MPSDLERVSHLPTTSAKIRALAARGLARADIARLLGIRYQHVRNVLEHDKARTAEASEFREREAAYAAPVRDLPAVKARLGPDGRIVMPAMFREALGLKEGDVLYARLKDGEMHLLTPAAAMRRAQSLVREFVPEGVSLVDELLEERRREVEREGGRD